MFSRQGDFLVAPVAQKLKLFDRILLTFVLVLLYKKKKS